jgi:hypothetical protein
MSIHFEKPMNDETQSLIKKMLSNGELGELKAWDDQNVLLEKMELLHQQRMKEIANTAKQPLTVRLNDIGEEVEMADGTVYICTKDGWVKK